MSASTATQPKTRLQILRAEADAQAALAATATAAANAPPLAGERKRTRKLTERVTGAGLACRTVYSALYVSTWIVRTFAQVARSPTRAG